MALGPIISIIHKCLRVVDSNICCVCGSHSAAALLIVWHMVHKLSFGPIHLVGPSFGPTIGGTVYRSSAAQRCLSYRPKQYSYAVLYFFRVRIPILTKKEIYKERKLRFPLIRHFSHWKIE